MPATIALKIVKLLEKMYDFRPQGISVSEIKIQKPKGKKLIRDEKCLTAQEKSVKTCPEHAHGGNGEEEPTRTQGAAGVHLERRVALRPSGW